MTRRFLLALSLSLSLAVSAARAEPSATDPPVTAPPATPAAAPPALPERPVPAAERALIFSVDGLRPDLLIRAKTPNVRRMIESGSFSFWARTVPAAVTLPSHASMLTGVSPEKHGVYWNDDLEKPAYPKVPTLFEIAKKAGYSTALVAGKSKFVTLAKPGTVDWPDIEGRSDDKVLDATTALLRAHRPQVMFVHFPGADGTGHKNGWGTPEQIAAIENIDRAIGEILKVLDETGLASSTVVLLSADHGGAGITHGPGDERSRNIPWIVSGPGVRRNYDLTRHATLTVNTEDTFSTVCYFLGLKPEGEIDGKPVLQVLQTRELLQDAPATPTPAAPAPTAVQPAGT